MKIRLVRDGSWWLDDRRVPAAAVGVDVPGVTHFCAEVGEGADRASAFCVIEGGEVAQVDSEAALDAARGVAARTAEILSAADELAALEIAAVEMGRAAVEAARPSPDRRAARYRIEADPFLLAATGYALEHEANPTQATLDKLTKAKADYLAAKAKIRAEIP